MPGLVKGLAIAFTSVSFCAFTLMHYVHTEELVAFGAIYPFALMYFSWLVSAWRYMGGTRRALFGVLGILQGILIGAFFYSCGNSWMMAPLETSMLFLAAIFFGGALVAALALTVSRGGDASKRKEMASEYYRRRTAWLKARGTTRGYNVNAVLRNAAVIMAATNTLSAVAAVCVMFLCYRSGVSGAVPLAIALSFTLLTIGDAWLSGKIRLERNTWFFMGIAQTVAAEEGRVPSFVSKATVQVVRAAFFFMALATPAECINRIRESVTPDIGNSLVEEEIEFAIPDFMMSKLLPQPTFECSRTVIVPAVMQGKSELTSGLEMRFADGSSARKMTDDEMEDAFCEQLELLMHPMRTATSQEEANAVRKFYRELMCDDVREMDARFERRKREAVANLIDSIKGEMPGESRQAWFDYLSLLMDSLRFSKPLCIEYPLTPADRVLSIHVRRTAPLVPVRVRAIRGIFKNVRGGEIGSVKARLLRLFTKRRRCYYLGLGNADRCRSYHLTFNNPAGTNLVWAMLSLLDGVNGLAFADKAVVTSRGDQSHLKMYIRNGRGFNRVALHLSFDVRSHRTTAFMCWTAFISFVLLTYIGFNYVPVLGGCKCVDVEMMGLCFAVLALSALTVVWEAMEKDHAEEWLWLASGGSVVIAVCALVYMAFVSIAPSAVNHAPFSILWIGALSVEYAIVLLSFAMFVKNTVQRGEVLDKVPHTRSLDEPDNEFVDFRSAKTRLEDGARQSYDLLLSEPKGSVNGNRKRYLHDIAAYRMLVKEDWSDGWLIPEWASASNYYWLPSPDFLSNLERAKNRSFMEEV